MRRLTLLLVLFTSFSLFANSARFTKEYTTGEQPIDIVYDEQSNLIHIFCNGIDNNFNGIYDESDGDIKASWWILDATSTDAKPMEVKEFDRYMTFPLNVNLSIDGESNIIIPFAPGYNSNFEIIENSVIKSFSASDYSEMTSKEASSSFKYIESNSVKFNSVNANVYLRDDMNNENDGVNLSIDFLQLDTLINTGVNPVDMEYFLENGQTLRVAVLNNGPYSTNESTLNLITFNSLNDFSIDTIDVGMTANSMSIDEGKIYIAANGSHQIFIYDLATTELISYNTPTEGFNGPREVIHNNGELYVTTYNQDLIIMDAEDGNIVEMHRTKGLNEASIINNNKLYISVPLKGDYSANNILTEYALSERSERNWVSDTEFLGYQPIQIIEEDDNYFVICNGIDFNFDGIINTAEGEQYPSIWKTNFNNAGEFVQTEKLSSLEFQLAFPFRGTMNEGEVLIPSGNMVYSYDTENDTLKSIFEHSNIDASIVSSKRFAEFLICGVRIPDQADKLFIINLNNDQVLSKEIGENVIEIEIFENSNTPIVYVLNEGLFSESNSSLDVFSFDNDNFEVEILNSFELGDTANDLEANFEFNKLAITMNGSHEVHIFDTQTQQILNTISTQTDGFNGPRESTWDGNRVMVTTYNSEILMFDTELENPVITRLDNKYLSEDILSEGQYFINTNIFFEGYESSNMIQSGNFVVNDIETQLYTSQNELSVYPIPTSDKFTIEDKNALNHIRIFTIDGQLVYEKNSSLKKETLNLNFPNGNYIISSGNKSGRLVIQ